MVLDTSSNFATGTEFGTRAFVGRQQSACRGGGGALHNPIHAPRGGYFPRTMNRGYTYRGGCCKARDYMSYLPRSLLADDPDGGSRIDATRPYPDPPPPLPPPLPPDPPPDRRWAPARRGSLSLTISPLIIRTSVAVRSKKQQFTDEVFCLCCGECCRENSKRRGRRG